MATHRHATYHDLQGKRAIVLACTAGIGRAVAVALAEQGCRIALLSRNLTKLQRLQEQLQGESRVFQVGLSDLTEYSTPWFLHVRITADAHQGDRHSVT